MREENSSDSDAERSPHSRRDGGAWCIDGIEDWTGSERARGEGTAGRDRLGVRRQVID